MFNSSIRGSHPVMRAILSAADRIATTDACVLISGEKGTGKELLARHIHAASPRRNRPFVRIDCQDSTIGGAGSEMSSELARELAGGTAAAWFERARGGTLFLDQIGALHLPLTAGPRARSLVDAAAAADVRLLAARAPVEALPAVLAADDVTFFEIPVPALRQRRSDIPLLVEHFLHVYATRHAVGLRRIETEAMVQLWQYDWPGNVRELESVVERIVVLNRSGIIRVPDLPRHIGVTGSQSRTHASSVYLTSTALH